MTKLKVLYDSTADNKGQRKYIKAIQKNIECQLIDICDRKEHEIRYSLWHNPQPTIAIKPLTDVQILMIKESIKAIPKYDIEGIFTGKLTITAEAILNAIGEVKGKRIAIINKSKTIGLPLATEIIERGGIIHLFGSRLPEKELFEFLKDTKIDALVTATGNKDFKIPTECIEHIPIVIDLSKDTHNKATTKISAIEVLKNRIKDYEK